MFSLYFLLILALFADQNLVERFVLIATTGKNAKTSVIPL
jgi:hypothetical protein